VKPWLKKLTAGEAICAIALTEPRGGSDAANLRLKIERDGDTTSSTARRPRSRPPTRRMHRGLRPHRHGGIRARTA
jgi:hypothetical protein